MDVFDEYFLELINSLHANQVEYIFVGGLATNLNGYSRFTSDVDIWLKDEPENRKRLRKSLREIELGDLPMIETIDFIPGWSAISLNSGVELDIMTNLLGLEEHSFDEVYKLCPTAEIYSVKVKFLHINFLIENKKKVNRDKDKIDVANLERIKKESENNSEKK
ncbi:MAG: hypothetical protein IAF38_01995 [Bacteroidia bacterium]|nr:hypothetical protein [Bacteroidia bacterium]